MLTRFYGSTILLETNVPSSRFSRVGAGRGGGLGLEDSFWSPWPWRVKSLASNPPGPRKLACPWSRTSAFCFLL